MSPRKLSDDDRIEILNLYRNSEENIGSLAIRYEVSTSTISRFLKSTLSSDEYEDLIKQKRITRGNQISLPKEIEEKNPDLPPAKKTKVKSKSSLKEIKQKENINLMAKKSLPEFETENNKQEYQENLSSFDNLEILSERTEIYLDEKEDFKSVNLLQEMFGEDVSDDLDEDDLDEDDLDEDDLDEKTVILFNKIKVLPLSLAKFPNICYLVIDTNSELITRPLKDFRELGEIPSQETSQKTLPIFDNHRVAKRFSNRRGKVIKVSDSSIFHKTSTYLAAKGITRLLIDGKIYSLS